MKGAVLAAENVPVVQEGRRSMPLSLKMVHWAPFPPSELSLSVTHCPRALPCLGAPPLHPSLWGPASWSSALFAGFFPFAL